MVGGETRTGRQRELNAGTKKLDFFLDSGHEVNPMLTYLHSSGGGTIQTTIDANYT